MVRRLLFYALLAICLILLARVGERHAFRVDLSTQRINSLSSAAASALDALPDGLQITAFVPDYPVQRAQLRQLLAPYLAHMPQARLEFVDPIREPGLAREYAVARHGEVHLASGSRREVIAVPGRRSIDLALNRLALRGERWIVSLKGHGESQVDDTPGGLGRFVAHVERLGYRFVTLDPRQLDALPENTALLLIAGPRAAYADHTQALIEAYLAGGGPLLWLIDGPLPDFVGRDLGIALLPGIVVDAAAARYQLDSPDNAIVSELPGELSAGQTDGGVGVLKQARALQLNERAAWVPRLRLQSSPRSWNETGDLRGQVARDPQNGEQAGPLTVGVVMGRRDGQAGQDVAFIGTRYLVGNDQIGQAANMGLAVGLVRWLTANRDLGAPEPSADLEIRWSPQLAGWLALSLMGGLPAAYLVAGLWLRARRRRA